MQIVSSGDSLHEMSNPVFWKKKNKKNSIKFLSAEIAQRVVMIKKNVDTVWMKKKCLGLVVQN